MCLNHPEQVHNHPAHTEFPGSMCLNHPTVPNLLYPHRGKQDLHGAYALIQGGSSTSNHFITEIARCGEF